MKKTFYITTPIYYANGKPSIGHAYTTIAADVLARYHRMLGKEVFFLTGTDENAQKNVESAEKAGKGDDVKGFLDEMAAVWQESFDSLGMTHNRFIRTTDADHLESVNAFWRLVQEKGDIYEGEYEGLYCEGCEAFVTDADLVDGLCPHHKKAPKSIKEKNYFFKLTKYKDALLKHINDNPDFVMPKSRRNEIVSYIENFMTDISISRSTMEWGIPVPGDESQRIYVWFDALINYISGVGFGTEEDKYKKFWPADVQLVGKDIIKFHCALWPAMLMSAGLPLPKHVFAHGFFTINGQKMSKSLGNVIDPVDIANQYSNDVLRFFLLREIRFGEDGDFSEARLAERYTADLANELGNLVNRVLAMTEKYFDGKVPETSDSILKTEWVDYHKALEELRFHDAIDIAWGLMRASNQYIEQMKPWALAKEDETKLKEVMYNLLETLRHIGLMALPFMPDSAEKLFDQLQIPLNKIHETSVETQQAWGGLKPGHTIKKGDPLFPRLEE